MAGFQLLLDPTSEASGTQLDVSDGAINNGVGYRLTGLSIDDPALKTTYADSVSTWGGIPSFPHGYGSATVTFSNRIGGSSAANLLTKVNALREKLGKFNREGGTVRIVYPSGDTLTFDVTQADGQGTAFDNAWVGRNRAAAEVKLTCRPGGRGAEQSLGTFTETTLPVLSAVVSGVKGSLLAHGRAVVTATAGDQWAIFSGVQSRYYDSGADAALFFEAEGRTPLGGAAIAAGSATPSGAGSNVMRQGTLTGTYQAMMSTHALAGTPMSHIGSFEVLARVYRPTANTGAVSLYLEWGAADFQTPTKNAPIEFGDGDYEGQWLLAKLGPVHIPKLTQGTQKWEGRIVAKSTVLGDDLDIDWIGLVPTTAGGDPASYGEWSGIQRFDTPTTFSGRDEFEQSAGSITGKTAPVGGVYVGGGDADDFTLDTANDWIQRTATSDSLHGRYVTVPVSMAACGAQVDFNTTVLTSTLWQGVTLRQVDFTGGSEDLISVGVGRATDTSFVTVRRWVNGTLIQQALGIPALPMVWHTMRVLVDANGRLVVWVFPVGQQPGGPVAAFYVAEAATGGVLASGNPGVFDFYSSVSAVTRMYDNFMAFVPTADAACFATRTLEIRHDRAERYNAAGTTPNRVSSRRGNYLRFAPGAAEGRSNRFFLKGVRGPEVQTNVWADTTIDDIAVDLFATPLGVSVPEP